MPKAFVNTSSLRMTLGEILLHKDQTDLASNKLFEFVIPDFQRGFVWTHQQSVRFIESLWLDIPVGSYMVNRMLGHPYDNYLIDGQQRIMAIHLYVTNQIEVLGYTYNNLPDLDKRRFRNLIFPRTEIQETDLSRLKEIYNRFNFGGTPHKPNETA